MATARVDGPLLTAVVVCRIDAARDAAVVIGAVLAGGRGSRLGGVSKAMLEVGGRPLVAYPTAALVGVCERVAVVGKADTELPELPGVERWDEPDEPGHPLTGIVHALERAGAPVLVCAADMPYVTPDACRTLLQSAGSGAGSPAVVAAAGGTLQPVFGLYAPAALEHLRAAPDGVSLTATVEGLEPLRVALPPTLVQSVNTEEDLEEARRRIGAQPAEPGASATRLR